MGQGISRLAGLVESHAESERRQQAEDERFEAYCQRRLARLRAWAMKQDHVELSENFALAALLAIERKKTHNVMRRNGSWTQSAFDEALVRLLATQRVAETFAAEAMKAKEDRRRGAEAKKAANPAQAAKVTAIGLWPKAYREGWSAAQMHTRLVGSGHEVAFTTVQKWMARLRKGEDLT